MHTEFSPKRSPANSGINDILQHVGLKDVKIRSSSALKVVGDEDSYAVSPRAPLLTTDLQNNAFLCGEARFGQLGTGVRPVSHHRPVPTPQPQTVAGDNSWAIISLGSFHAAAITSQGKLYTWGLNSKGQCGVVEPDPADRGRITYYPGPARVKSSTTGGTYKAVACGGEHTVALGSRGVCAWGNNARGQLGLGAGTPAVVWRPMVLPGLSRLSITQLVCGAHHSMALTAQSQVFAWGANDAGQLGVGDTTDRHMPTAVEGLWGLPITRLAAGDTHSLALTTTGQLFSWGCNSHGQCGVTQPSSSDEKERANAGSDSRSDPEDGPTSLESLDILTSSQGSGPLQHEEQHNHTEPMMRSHSAGTPQAGADLENTTKQQWTAVMVSMGITAQLADMCLHVTGYKGVEVAVDWLFSQNESEVRKRLERWKAMQQHQQHKDHYTHPGHSLHTTTSSGHQHGTPFQHGHTGYSNSHTEVLDATTASDSRHVRGSSARSRLARTAPPAASAAAPAPDAVHTEFLPAPQNSGGSTQAEEQIVLSPMEVQLQGVRAIAAGMCFSVAITEVGDAYSWGMGSWGALGHGDLQDKHLPTWVEALEGAVIEKISCGQYHTTFIARDGAVYGCGRCESGQLGNLSTPASANAVTGSGSSGENTSIINLPVQLQLTACLMDQLSATQGNPFQNGSPAANTSSNSCSDGMSDTEVDLKKARKGGLKTKRDASPEAEGNSESDTLPALLPSPCKTIVYDVTTQSPPVPGVVLHELVAGGCNTAILLRRQQENPSPWQVTLLAKLQAAVARAVVLQNNAAGPTQALAVAIRNVSRGAQLVLSSPAALCAALAVRPRNPASPSSISLPESHAAIPGAVRTPSAAQAMNPIFGSVGSSNSVSSPVKKGSLVAGGMRRNSITFAAHSPNKSPRFGRASVPTFVTGNAPAPMPLPLDVMLLDDLYRNLLQLAGAGRDPAFQGALSIEGDSGPAMVELQRCSLQQALLRCSLQLCEDLMAHAPLLRAPERAQVLLAALHCPLLSDPAHCKQLLPKLCHAVLAAPAAARRLLVRWWASYPPELLLERLVQPMQAFITKELAAFKKLTSSIMAVIKVLARIEAANQLAGSPLPPDAFYNTLISEKMDVQDHYSAWRTTQDLGGGLPGVRPVTNTSGAQYYACEPDSDNDTNNHTCVTVTVHNKARSASSNGTRGGHRTGTHSNPGTERRPTIGGAPPASARNSEAGHRDSETGWEHDNTELSGRASMRMSDPGRRTAGNTSSAALNATMPTTFTQSPGPTSTRRTTYTGTSSELQRRHQASDAALMHRTTGDTSRGNTAVSWADTTHAHTVTLPPLPYPPTSNRSSRAPVVPNNPAPSPARPTRESSRRSSLGGGGYTTMIPERVTDREAYRASLSGSTTAPLLSDNTTYTYHRHASHRHSEGGAASRTTSSASRPADRGHTAPEQDTQETTTPQPTQRAAAEPGPFSFCTYPFLLDARAKSNLLHIEARFQMEQTVAHARMEQQLYGHNVRLGRNESGYGTGRSGRRSSDAGGSSSDSWPGQDLMLHVLEKTAAVEDHEDDKRGSKSSNGASSSSGTSRSRSSKTKGFRGLLASLLRHGVSRTVSGHESIDQCLFPDKRAESFRLPTPRECNMPGTHSDMCILRVRRTHLVEDALDEITRQTRRDLFKPLRVHFIGEEGIDAGGVKKEFFALLLAELLKPEFGLMEVQPESNTYWFPAHSMCVTSQYQLLGLVLGLAVYNRVLLDFPLPMAAYKKLLGMPVGLRDLQEFSPALGNSLKSLLELEGPPGTVEDMLCLSWAVEHQAWGQRTITELIPNGEQIPVTEENREAYVEAMIDFHLNSAVKWQFEAFARGFGVLCNGPALRLFNAQELERLVCGNPTLDWAALQKNAKYEGGYTASSQVVVWLWEMVRGELPLEEKKRFLKFFTGSDRAPIGGLGTLKCLIQRAGPDSERLPTSHTCFNTLLLPEYMTKAKLARQLRNAINNAEGFGME